ncbi:1919_t:CDS:1, partial [Acaulospora colombiana]
SPSRYLASPIRTETVAEQRHYHDKSSEDREMDDFHDSIYKERVGKEIIQSIGEKKIRDQESLTTLPEEERPQDLNSDAQSHNSTSSEVSANSDGSKLPPEGKICSETNSKCKKSVGKLKQELFTPQLSSQEPSIEQYHTTEIPETSCPGKVTSGDNSSIDEASQHLAQLCDKAFDAEDKANRANQKEILCWSLYAKDFRIQLNGIIENSG